MVAHHDYSLAFCRNVDSMYFSVTVLRSNGSNKQLQPTAVLADFTYSAHLANRPLILAVILRSVKGTFLMGCAAVYRSMTGCAYLKLCELIELDLNSIIRIALTLSLSFPSLCNHVSSVRVLMLRSVIKAYIF